MDLNDVQRRVISHGEGPLVVTAVAGAGKTRTLIFRIAALVLLRNVEPRQILATTFTVKAATEMAERLRGIRIPVADWRTPGVTVGTVHSVALQILKSEKADFGRWRRGSAG
jgi:DNA helicase-2/ATP-dependent DNA helicase PcrA